MVARIESQGAGKAWGEIDSKLCWEILVYMLHLADISNPGKFFELYPSWIICFNVDLCKVDATSHKSFFEYSER